MHVALVEAYRLLLGKEPEPYRTDAQVAEDIMNNWSGQAFGDDPLKVAAAEAALTVMATLSGFVSTTRQRAITRFAAARLQTLKDYTSWGSRKKRRQGGGHNPLPRAS